MARLVVVGDSLALGAQSFAVASTGQSFPVLIARSMGLTGDQFRSPDFSPHGGLPFNIEWVARRLEEEYGENITGFKWAAAALRLVDMMEEVRGYWRSPPPADDVLYHNLSVWAYDVQNAWQITSAFATEHARQYDTPLQWPMLSLLKVAQRVLNPADRPARQHETLVDQAVRISTEEGGVDHLIVELGVNNCSRAVIEFTIREPEQPDVSPFSGITLWTPEAFNSTYAELCDRLEQVHARHTYLSTVPHVTVAPLLRGRMEGDTPLPDGSLYFDHYVHMIHSQKTFDPQRHAHLKRDEVERIDARVDEFNAIIRRQAEQRGWDVVDLCELYDQLVLDRNHGTPRYPLPAAFHDLTAEAFTIDPEGRLVAGGLVALDGFHPTGCGSALVAQHYLEVMRRHEPGLPDIDFAAVRAADTLVNRPPKTLDDIFGMLAVLEEKVGISRLLTRWISLLP